MNNREEFEKWAVRENFDIFKWPPSHPFGNYFRIYTLGALDVWQARQPEVDALKADNAELLEARDKRVSESLRLEDENTALKAEVERLKAAPTPPALTQDAIRALEPFAEIGAWLFARKLPDETPVVQINSINGATWNLTRGHFKAAHTARKAALAAAPTPPAQDEPVAWVNSSDLITAEIDRGRYNGGYSDGYVWWGSKGSRFDVPLYTHPQSDKLRDAAKEIERRLRNAGLDYDADYLRAALEGK